MLLQGLPLCCSGRTAFPPRVISNGVLTCLLFLRLRDIKVLPPTPVPGLLAVDPVEPMHLLSAGSRTDATTLLWEQNRCITLGPSALP